MWIPSLALLSLLLPAPAPSATPAPACPATRALDDEALEKAAADVREALRSGRSSMRKESLARLVDLALPEVLDVLQPEYAKASEGLRATRDRVVQAQYVIERKQALLAELKLRAERDGSLGDVAKAVQREIKDLAEKLERDLPKLARHQGACEDLGEATRQLFAKLPAGAKKKAEKAIWKDAEGHDDLEVRLGAIEMIGRFGEADTPTRMHKLLTKAEGERAKIKRKLPKLEKTVRDFETRIQEEMEKLGGLSRATGEQYESVKREAAKLRRETQRLAFLVDASAEAAGRSLARLDGEPFDKQLATLLRSAKKGKGPIGSKTLSIFGHAPRGKVSEALLALLDEIEEPPHLATVVDALAQHGDASVVGALVAGPLEHEDWNVKSRAAAALGALRHKDSIAPLIERLGIEEGRVKTDIANALTSLTGKKFRTRAELWARWWKEEGAAFEVAAEEPEIEGSLDAEEALGVTFFGIRTESQRVLFVCDASLSMTFAMIPRKNPGDEPGRPFDEPKSGEDSRLDVAQRQLVQALGGIRDGGTFNIVTYAADVWRWREQLVEMSDKSRAEAVDFATTLKTGYGTNIYSALREAFDVAGVREDGKWTEPKVDTIFFLSDGRPTVGLTTSASEILAYVRERNQQAGIVVHTIGLSGAQDAFLMRSLAEENGGTYAAR